MNYSVFDIFQKVVFCMAFYSRKVNFVMIRCIFCRNYISTKGCILFDGFQFFPLVEPAANYAKINRLGS